MPLNPSHMYFFSFIVVFYFHSLLCFFSADSIQSAILCSSMLKARVDQFCAFFHNLLRLMKTIISKVYGYFNMQPMHHASDHHRKNSPEGNCIKLRNNSPVLNLFMRRYTQVASILL